MSSTEDEVRSFGTVEEVRMMLAEAGHPDVPVRTDPDGWAIPLGDEPRQAPEGVHWRITQLITQRYNDPDGSWCWACYQAGYDADECEADFPMAQDCGRHRGPAEGCTRSSHSDRRKWWVNNRILTLGIDAESWDVPILGPCQSRTCSPPPTWPIVSGSASITSPGSSATAS